ncbi:MAG TPA: lysylphosphatidylglycerol synthase transmembrane domain-containing protein [Gaiellaceae bacterium]
MVVVGVALGITATTFAVLLPRVAGYGAVWHVVSNLSWPWLAGLGAVTVLNVLTFPLPWVVVLPGLPYLRALLLTQVSTAFTLILPGGMPVGIAASLAMLRSAGFRSAEVGRAVATTGLWNQLSTFLFPLLAAGWLAVEGTAAQSVLTIALVGGGLFLVAAATLVAFAVYPSAAATLAALGLRIVSRLPIVGRQASPPWSEGSLLRFRNETISLLRERWVALTIATAVNQLTGWAILELALRAVGIGVAQVSVGESFAAWSVGRLLASLPLTPGGIGFVELGLTGTLVAFGGPNAQVVAGVLVYRFLSIAPVLVAAAVGGPLWNRLGGQHLGGRGSTDASSTASGEALIVSRKNPG